MSFSRSQLNDNLIAGKKECVGLFSCTVCIAAVMGQQRHRRAGGTGSMMLQNL